MMRHATVMIYSRSVHRFCNHNMFALSGHHRKRLNYHVKYSACKRSIWHSIEWRYRAN